jgi:hypothetical protein
MNPKIKAAIIKAPFMAEVKLNVDNLRKILVEKE